jgi:hypothetical protein
MFICMLLGKPTSKMKSLHNKKPEDLKAAEVKRK